MRRLIPLILILLIAPVCYASLDEYMDEVDSYVDDYNSGKLNAAELIVYLEYTTSKMYESLDKEHKEAFTESDVKKALGEKYKEKDKKKHSDWRESQHEKVFSTDDFDVVFMAHQFYRQDREYYESKEEDTETYYKVGYDLRPIKSSQDIDAIGSDIKSFINELKSLSQQEDPDLEDLKEKFNKIKRQVWEIDNCESLMSSVLEETEEEPTKETHYSLQIKEETEENCWDETQCKQVCEPEEMCWEKCDMIPVCEEICDQECHEEEKCEEVCENITEGNETRIGCHDKCIMEEVCSDNCWEDCHDEHQCKQVCETKENCYDKCEPFQQCENMTNGELRIEGICGDDFSDIHINAYGPGLDYYNELNDFDERIDCEERIQALVNLRKAIQDNINNNFAKWYFEEFLKDDPEKIINGGYGFRKILDILTRNEEDISNELFCLEEIGWPDGFEKIDVEYKTDNTNVEVWEKRIPVEGTDVRYWTTLYKYSWIPNKDVVKELIQYKMSEQDTIGPTAKDIAEIKADEGKMEIIERLSEKYGGSFDVKLEMLDEKNTIVKKYLQINPDVAVKITDELEEGKPDVSVSIDFNILYNFITYMSYTMEGDKIQGPHWVHVDEGGPGKVFSALGAISKLWREGITIKPRHALFKLFFNTKDIISLATEAQIESSSSEYGKEEGKEVKINANVVLDKGVDM